MSLKVTEQHFHSLIAILKIGILIELFHNPWNPYWRTERAMNSRLSAGNLCIEVRISDILCLGNLGFTWPNMSSVDCF